MSAWFLYTGMNFSMNQFYLMVCNLDNLPSNFLLGGIELKKIKLNLAIKAPSVHPSMKSWPQLMQLQHILQKCGEGVT